MASAYEQTVGSMAMGKRTEESDEETNTVYLVRKLVVWKSLMKW